MLSVKCSLALLVGHSVRAMVPCIGAEQSLSSSLYTIMASGPISPDALALS